LSPPGNSLPPFNSLSNFPLYSYAGGGGSGGSHYGSGSGFGGHGYGHPPPPPQEWCTVVVDAANARMAPGNGRIRGVLYQGSIGSVSGLPEMTEDYWVWYPVKARKQFFFFCLLKLSFSSSDQIPPLSRTCMDQV